MSKGLRSKRKKEQVPGTGKGLPFCVVVCLLAATISSHAQKEVRLDDHFNQHIFSYGEIESFEDSQDIYTISEVSAPDFAKFQPGREFIPKNYHYKSTYWYRIRVGAGETRQKNWILEFYDPTIDHIAFYAPTGRSVAGSAVTPATFKEYLYGAGQPFAQRLYYHKNFTIPLDGIMGAAEKPGSPTNDDANGSQDGIAGAGGSRAQTSRVYYFSVQSSQPANIMVVLKPIPWFVEYGLKEYFFSGIFYGMILVFCLYNLVMFFAFRQKQYLYYIMYNLSIGVFEMSSNGFAYQYLWPGAPAWNEIASGVALYSASAFSLLFTREFLSLRTRAPLLNKIILSVAALRTIFFLLCLFVSKEWFIYKFIDAVPLLVAFYAGWYILRKKYYPARFFVAGYSFLLLGFLIRVLKTLATQNFPFGPLNFYSLSFSFLAEMLFVSFAIGDKVKWLRKKKDLVQQRMMEEMRINQQLKDNLNTELEKQVTERTREVIEKSAVIEQQNEELLSVNDLLKHQAEEIIRMNEILDRDNKVLQVDIKKVTQARVMSAEMDFGEFARIYPDDQAGFKFLADLKWDKGYTCRKCDNETFFNGHLPYSRRCSKCSYEESATTNTIFQNAHIPLNKAFYMAYMVYSTKGKISSYKLSEILSIRQSTCWSYTGKVKKLMEERKKELRDAGEKGWSKLVIR
ncbi:MAG TPA: 7TM diverse intracellular signaling domain-containing protein [Puia sp.]|nr:7TM diverse intracellular signaling domain-containing protein [Puia sp.]